MDSLTDRDQWSGGLSAGQMVGLMDRLAVGWIDMLMDGLVA